MNAQEQDLPNNKISLLSLPDVVKRVGFKRSTIWDRVKAGTFPKPIKLSTRCSRWPSNEVDDWISKTVAESNR